MECRSDATSFPFRLASVSSHHSHSLPPGYFPRCGGGVQLLVAVPLPVAQGWNCRWRSSPCALLLTLARNICLSSSPPPPWLGHCSLTRVKTKLRRRQSLSTGRVASLSNNFHSDKQQQTARMFPRSHASSTRPAKVRTTVGRSALWVMRSKVFLFFFRRKPVCATFPFLFPLMIRLD